MNKLIAHFIVALAALGERLNPFRRARVALENAIVNRTVILGVRSLKFARDGADNSGTAVSSTHQPAADAAVYESLGGVESLQITKSVDNLKIKNASGGVYKLTKTIPLSQELMLTFTMQDLNQIAVESLLMTSGAITVGTEYEPLNQGAPIRGWIEVKLSDQTKTNTLLFYLWVDLNVSAKQVGEKQYTYELTAEVLDNSLNTAEIDALTAN